MKGILLAAALVWAGDPIAAWERHEKRVRDQEAPKDSLRAEFPAVMAGLKARFAVTGAAGTATTVSATADSPWVFPLKGYGRSSVGKGGYLPGIRYGGSPIKGYDFFDGKRHGGHPAYDIFIRDKDQDSREDKTGMPVDVLAPADMIVISRETEWTKGSDLRGGKYLWAYAPKSNLLIYFAHLDSVMARPGDSLLAGQALGTVGRTGKNAAVKRSPTHLHLMVLRAEADKPLPYDYFRLLK